MNILKKGNKFTYSKLFFCVLLLLIAINFLGAFYHKELFMQTASLLFIPVFLLVFLIKYKKLSLPFISFLVLSFLGDISSVFLNNDTTFYISNILHALSFVYLLLIVIPKFKLFNLDKIVGLYLVVVFFINIYFLFALQGVLKSTISDDIEVNLFTAKSLVLIILAFLSFGIYLNTQTKRSILFLASSVCFGFSTIIDYVNLYYFYDWNFIMLHKILYALGLYFLFSYAMIENYVKKFEPVEIKEETYPSDNILA